MEFNESPLFMLLDPVSKGLSAKKKLPITLFESELHVLNGAPTMLFVKAPFKVETSETEGISVDHISKIAPIGDSSKSSRTSSCALLLARLCSHSERERERTLTDAAVCLGVSSAPVLGERARCDQDARPSSRRARALPPSHEVRSVVHCS